MIYGLYVGNYYENSSGVRVHGSAATITKYNYSDEGFYNGYANDSIKPLYTELCRVPRKNYMGEMKLILPLEYMSKKRERLT